MAEYLKNCWYVAAQLDEVARDRATARIILEQRIALFRGEGGQPVALFDRCPHRFAQLHEGRVTDGIIECPYHGLRFDGAGVCVHNPHGDGTIPPQAQVRSFPVAERYGFIWIWPGDARLADIARIPDLSALDDSEPNAIIAGYMHTAANYELMTDNLMDLSHADYIHRDSLNTGGSLTKLRPKVKAEENSVRAFWSYDTDNVQPFFRSALEDPDGRCNQTFDMLWTAPSNLILAVTARNALQGPEHDAVYNTAHLLTPETSTSTHYWYKGFRNWDPANAALNEALRTGVTAAFESEASRS